MTYAHALEAIQARNGFAVEVAYQLIHRTEAHGEEVGGLHVEQMRAVVEADLRAAVPYWVSDELAELIFEAAINFPGETEFAEHLPFTPRGFVYFHTALPVLSKRTDEMIGLSSVAWRVFPDGLCRVIGFGGRADGSPIIDDWVYWVADISPGETLDEASRESEGSDSAVDPTVHPALRTAAAVWQLCHQKLLVTQPAPLDRAARRQLARLGPDEPPPRMIVLRKTVSARGGEPTGHHLTMRHIRSGHWRLQWFGSEAPESPAGPRRQQPIWLIPAIYGPPNAPLRAQGERLFSVSR